MSRKPLNIDWEAIKLVIAAGMDISTVAQRFGVSHWTLRKRIEREKWITPKNLEDKVSELLGETADNNVQAPDGEPISDTNDADTAELVTSEGRKVHKSVKVSPLDVVAESWAEKGEMHRRTVYDIAAKAIKKTKIQPPKNWKDLEIADKMARRAAGLKDDQASAVVNFGVFGSGGSFSGGYDEAPE